MTKKNDFNVSTEDLIFEEEVGEEELYSKKNVSDIIYNDLDVRKRRTKFLIFLAISLIIISIISALMGFIFLDKDLKEKKVNSIITKYDLFVTHSNSSYGGSISSFSDYRSLNNAYLYKFDVTNNNSIALDYLVEFINPNYGNDGVDMTLINYKLLKNNEIVSEGVLSNSMTSKLFNTEILSNSRDEYVLKIWSYKMDKKLKFDFKINVKV